SFVAKFDNNGINIWNDNIWGSSASNYVCGITFDGVGNAYTAGYFHSLVVDFHHGNFIKNLYNGTTQGFITKYNTAGKSQWAKKVGNNERVADNSVMDVISDNAGNLVVYGNFSSPRAEFGNGVTLTPASRKASFIARYSTVVVSVPYTPLDILKHDFTIHPNPTESIARISFTTTAPSRARLTLTDVLGRQTLLKEETLDAGEHSAEINTANFPAGIYVLTLEAKGQVFSQKVVIER
ncbi:MAG TPA: T9SS type A sorting domain-containing protein, partial [Patescibacteria group bacterium]|nr:T9SS type A sorting domain-containing protein [Patescibacteria group bacterium]